MIAYVSTVRRSIAISGVARRRVFFSCGRYQRSVRFRRCWPPTSARICRIPLACCCGTLNASLVGRFGVFLLYIIHVYEREGEELKGGVRRDFQRREVGKTTTVVAGRTHARLESYRSAIWASRTTDDVFTPVCTLALLPAALCCCRTPPTRVLAAVNQKCPARRELERKDPQFLVGQRGPQRRRVADFPLRIGRQHQQKNVVSNSGDSIGKIETMI